MNTPVHSRLRAVLTILLACFLLVKATARPGKQASRPAITAHPPLLSEKQAAVVFGVSMATIRRWKKLGRIPFFRVGGTGKQREYGFPFADLLDALGQLPVHELTDKPEAAAVAKAT